MSPIPSPSLQPLVPFPAPVSNPLLSLTSNSLRQMSFAAQYGQYPPQYQAAYGFNERQAAQVQITKYKYPLPLVSTLIPSNSPRPAYYFPSNPLSPSQMYQLAGHPAAGYLPAQYGQYGHMPQAPFMYQNPHIAGPPSVSSKSVLDMC